MEENMVETEQMNPFGVEENTVLEINPEVTIREEIEEDGRYVLFNAENELILMINPTGKFILDSCTGKTVGEITADIKKSFTLKEDIDVMNIVKTFANLLLKAKLVKIVED